jgi:hypothetical protein
LGGIISTQTKRGNHTMNTQNKVEFTPKSPALKTVVDVIGSDSFPTEIINNSIVNMKNFGQSEQEYLEKMSLQFALGYKDAVKFGNIETDLDACNSDFIDDIDSKMEKLVREMI